MCIFARACACTCRKLLPCVSYISMQQELPPQGFPFIIMQRKERRENYCVAFINYSFTQTNLYGLTAITHHLSRKNLWLHLNISRHTPLCGIALACARFLSHFCYTSLCLPFCGVKAVFEGFFPPTHIYQLNWISSRGMEGLIPLPC